jgi:hypothetical protein
MLTTAVQGTEQGAYQTAITPKDVYVIRQSRSVFEYTLRVFECSLESFHCTLVRRPTSLVRYLVM